MMTDEPKRVVIVGGGITGLACAHTVLEAGGCVTLIDKAHFIFPPTGNSSFSMSGINGCQSRIQKSQSIEDDVETFIADILKNGGKKTELIETLCSKSGEVINWLNRKFELGFVLSRSGGHTKARTHKTKDKCTGSSVTSKLAARILDIAKLEPERAQVLTNSTVSQLLVTNDKISGLEYEKGGKINRIACDAIILATGGYGSDFNSSTSLIARFRPDLIKLSTACTLTSTGDGIKLAEHVGAKTVDMMYVQVNPTGLVDPADPTNRVKIIASESLRGDGGIIIDKYGNRFVNEVAKRDFLSSEVMKNPNGPFRIILNSKTAKHLSSYIEDYLKKGLMRRYHNSAALAAEMLVSRDSLEKTFAEYNDAARQAQEANVADKFGKLHFRNWPFEPEDELTVGIIEPTIGYSVGGVAINTHAQVIGKDGEIIPGLFAAGEVTGGVHSCSNPLVGNDLLDCLVFGRISAVEAAKYVYGSDYVERRTNPEMIAAELRHECDLMVRKIFDKKNQIEAVKKDTEELRKTVSEDVLEVGKLCRKIVAASSSRNDIPELATLSVNPEGQNIDEVLNVVNVKEVAIKLRLEKRQVEAELEHLQGELKTYKSRISTIQEETEQAMLEQKNLVTKKQKMENELDRLRNSSSIVREIHELEALINEYKMKQTAAEDTKKAEEEELAVWKKEREAEIASLNKKKEEMYVMIHIERIEAKKEMDEIRKLTKKFSARFDKEKKFSQKALQLSQKENYPFFQRPVVLPPTID